MVINGKVLADYADLGRQHETPPKRYIREKLNYLFYSHQRGLGTRGDRGGGDG